MNHSFVGNFDTRTFSYNWIGAFFFLAWNRKLGFLIIWIIVKKKFFSNWYQKDNLDDYMIQSNANIAFDTKSLCLNNSITHPVNVNAISLSPFVFSYLLHANAAILDWPWGWHFWIHFMLRYSLCKMTFSIDRKAKRSTYDVKCRYLTGEIDITKTKDDTIVSFQLFIKYCYGRNDSEKMSF